MITGSLITIEGHKLKWRIGERLQEVNPTEPDPWFYPRSDDLSGKILQLSNTEYVYLHPDGRMFQAWTTL